MLKSVVEDSDFCLLVFAMVQSLLRRMFIAATQHAQNRDQFLKIFLRLPGG
jgi:hypothetical protein